MVRVTLQIADEVASQLASMGDTWQDGVRWSRVFEVPLGRFSRLKLRARLEGKDDRMWLKTVNSAVTPISWRRDTSKIAIDRGRGREHRMAEVLRTGVAAAQGTGSS